MTWLPLVSATLVLLGIIANVALALYLRAALRRVEAIEMALVAAPSFDSSGLKLWQERVNALLKASSPCAPPSAAGDRGGPR